MRLPVLVLLGISLATGQPKSFERSAKVGYESITTTDLKSHLTLLASPELEGRETSYRGQKVAAQYIAAVYTKIGLKPIGDNGTYFQQFELDVTRPSDESVITLQTTGGTVQYKFRKDFITTALRETSFTAPAVFIGYSDALLTPDQEASLWGKIVVTFAGRRSDALDTSATHTRRPFPRSFRGSAALISITNEAVLGSIENLSRSVANILEKGQMNLRGASRSSQFQGFLGFSVSSRLGSELLEQLGRPMNELRKTVALDTSFTPVLLDKISLTLSTRVHYELKTSENVVGLLEGSDSRLKDEYCVFTAHYDHLGVSASDGAIYFGADDDGSGTSTILELAEAFAMNPLKPKRSLVFMTVSGEEKGLLGSAYYADHPLVPLDKTIADFNIDMIGRMDKKYAEQQNPNYVYVIGSDKISTELDSLLRSANKESVNLTLDYTYNDDKDPNQFYRRSDHYNFARKGIPIVFFFTGIHEDYHRPTDTVDKIMFDKMVKIGQLAFYTGWKVANFRRLLLKDAGPSVYN